MQPHKLCRSQWTGRMNEWKEKNVCTDIDCAEALSAFHKQIPYWHWCIAYRSLIYSFDYLFIYLFTYINKFGLYQIFCKHLDYGRQIIIACFTCQECNFQRNKGKKKIYVEQSSKQMTKSYNLISFYGFYSGIIIPFAWMFINYSNDRWWKLQFHGRDIGRHTRTRVCSRALLFLVLLFKLMSQSRSYAEMVEMKFSMWKEKNGFWQFSAALDAVPIHETNSTEKVYATTV